MPTDLCSASAAATYYANPAWTANSPDPYCRPQTYMTGYTYGSMGYGAVSTHCNGVCDNYGPCKAYVATESYDPVHSNFQVACYLFKTQPPAPTSCTYESNDGVYAAYRDDARSCFSQSTDDAARFCNYYLSRSDPATVYVTTTTTTPTSTMTTTSYVTQSVCALKGGNRRAVGEYDPIPLVTEAPAVVTDAVIPVPTAPPRFDGINLGRRAVSAPAPQCLDTVNFPLWNVASACSCVKPLTAITKSGAFTKTGLVTTKIITKTTTTSVLKSSVPTFKPQVNVPGNKAMKSFNLISRVVKDSSNADKRVLMYTKPKSKESDNVAMHISPDKKMYIVTVGKNNLKSYGQLSFVTLSGGITVLGELGDGGGTGTNAELADCVAPKTGSITCKLKSGEAAVFSEVAIPGQKDKFAVAVGKKAAKGASVVTLSATSWGTVIVGCGTGGKD
ncbi:hypothetical protein Micbo1qcDRAFT_220242 [Microdochium bolleyi]|uniref:Uncharacterized protein n=1 Tax=Microdochium bolleyi TaxID=196109 RepID=A0A136J8W1_9PEZI|nr:hypothetical protein Micbo1qcDRAFT_220242 [Microdochium bolleyi]